MRNSIITVLVAVVVVACSPSNEKVHFLNIFNTKQGGEIARLGELEVIASDAKTRLVLSTIQKDDNGGERRIICAEPSPDALSQFSAEFAASLSVSVAGKGEGSGAIRESFQEVAKNIGKRTAAIQLLRDGFYRDCEAYANGRNKDFAYHMTLAHMPQIMIKLVAIESLTEKGFIPANEKAAALVEAATKANLDLAKLQATHTSKEAKEVALEIENRKTEDEKNGAVSRKTVREASVKRLNAEIDKKTEQRDKDKTAGKDTKMLDGEILADEQLKGAYEIEIADLTETITRKNKTIATLTGAITAAKLETIAAKQALDQGEGELRAKIAAGEAANMKLAPGVAGILAGMLGQGKDGVYLPNPAIASACMMWLAANEKAGSNGQQKNPDFASICKSHLVKVKMLDEKMEENLRNGQSNEANLPQQIQAVPVTPVTPVTQSK